MKKTKRVVGMEGVGGLFTLTETRFTAEGVERIDITPRSRTTDPDTSKAAAASMVDEAKAQRQAILRYLEAHPAGLCADRLDEALGWRDSRAGRRCPELVEQGEVFICDGREKVLGGVRCQVPELRQQTRSGRWAYVVMSVVHLDPSWRL